jgi:azurin
MADLQLELEEARNGQKDLEEISENREELQEKLSILESELEQARIGHCNLKEISDKLELEKKELADLKNQEVSELKAKLESTEFGKIESERHSLDIIDKLKAENETIKANSKTEEMSNQCLLTEKDEKLGHLESQANNYAQMLEKLNVEIDTLKTEILVKNDEISSIQNQLSQLGSDYQTKWAEMEKNNQMSIDENCVKLQAEISRLNQDLAEKENFFKGAYQTKLAEIEQNNQMSIEENGIQLQAEITRLDQALIEKENSLKEAYQTKLAEIEQNNQMSIDENGLKLQAEIGRLNQALVEKENFLKEAYETKLAEIEENNQMSVDENILRMQAEVTRLNQALAERENFIQEARNAIQEYETKIAVSIGLHILFLLFLMWILKRYIAIRC